MQVSFRADQTVWSYDPSCWELLPSQQVWRLLIDDAYEASGLKSASKVSVGRNEPLRGKMPLAEILKQELLNYKASAHHLVELQSLGPESIGRVLLDVGAFVQGLDLGSHFLYRIKLTYPSLAFYLYPTCCKPRVLCECGCRIGGFRQIDFGFSG